MDVLIRELRASKDGVEHHDVEFSGERIAIGSAADANIQMLGEGVAPRHATLMQAGAQLQIKCARRLQVRVNGKECNAALLNVGDTVELAGNRLRLSKAPTGFAFAIEIESNPSVDAGQFELAFQTDLEQAWLSKRRLAWLALIAVIVLTFVVPLSFALFRDSKPKVGAAQKPTIMSKLFGDALWSSGPLSPAHVQATNNQCNYCHQTLFVRVRDDACQACHKNISDHVHPDRAQLAGADAMGKVQRCASCHREHGESLDELIPRADQLCTSCHAKGATRFANLKLLDVSAFEEKLHPPFAPRLLVPASSDGLTWKMEKTPLATASDHSNLKFSHRQHLDKDRVIRSSDGGALNCGDCHRPTLDGKRFLPITMQETCSSCHELSFDPAAPERQLPHGKPREAILVLQEYYARRYSDPAAAPVVRERRRLPGRSDEVTVCTAGPLPCARQAAANEIEGQFTRRGCVTCHEVNDTQNADIYERYQVRPVKLSTDFFPAARFDHAPHRIQKDRTGDAACLACHKANESAESSDLLLPDEPKCLECHRTHPGTSLGAEQIVSPCIACHEYHPRTSAAQLTMSDAGVTSKKP